MKEEAVPQKKTLTVTEVQGVTVVLSDDSRYTMPAQVITELRIGAGAYVIVTNTEEGQELYFWFTMLALAKVNFGHGGRYLRARNERTNTEVTERTSAYSYAFAH